MARNVRLNERKAGMVSAEDVAKAEGELKVADAQVHEAKENEELSPTPTSSWRSRLSTNTRSKAPFFDGVIIKRMKNMGESVRANEAVVQLGNLYKLSANAYVPLDFISRIKEGQIVEGQPRVSQRKGESQAIEKKRFREQDHVCRSADPAGRGDGCSDPRRVREPDG